MDWDKLRGSSEMEHAPESGIMLVYTRKKVIFERYQSLQQAGERLRGEEILEVHLFDKEKEYRALASQSKRFPGHFIDKVFRVEEKDKDCIYSQEILLEMTEVNKTGMEKIQVNNHIPYSDTGMAVIDRYQFVEVG